ncbi:MAG: protoheme IX farnesyltransferase [Candidatus Brocadiae bacterium]|nr:protoheme IX farnesyltransferase [Candidatus Brocadiia bacterium]
MTLARRIADYAALTKPGISIMVLVTTTAGFFIATRGRVEIVPLLNVLLGTVLTAAAANAINMLMEIETDRLMKRTAARPLPSGRMNASEVAMFGGLCFTAGVAWLFVRVNTLTAVLGATTVLSYLFIYTPLKRRTPLSTIAGAFPGALPPLIGWAAATGSLNFEAWILFAIQFFWQIPHFLAIAWNLRDDYKAAGFPLLATLSDDGRPTARQIVFQSQVLLVVSLLPAMQGRFDVIYFSAALALGIAFLVLGVQFAMAPSQTGARRVFWACPSPTRLQMAS